tara:strand:- start:66 stop:635 length:570 start_codon:yes stop_codon:yes gene_type:complete
MKKEKVKIYILSLMVDQTYGPGFTTRDQWISTSKKEIEKKKETKWQELLDYFGIKQLEPEVIYECEHCSDDFIDMKSKESEREDWFFEDPDIQEEFKEFLKNREKCDYDEFANTTDENDVIVADHEGEIFTCGCNHENLENGVAYVTYSIEAQIEELERKGICYGNRDLDSFPELYINEIEVTKEVKDF